MYPLAQIAQGVVIYSTAMIRASYGSFRALSSYQSVGGRPGVLLASCGIQSITDLDQRVLAKRITYMEWLTFHDFVRSTASLFIEHIDKARIARLIGFQGLLRHPLAWENGDFE